MHFDIFADISTYCNAGCPQCHRTNPNGLGKAEWLPLINWSLEQFKQAYRPSTLKLTRNIQFCGTWGDPIMNKDIFEICKYILDVTKETTYYNKTKILINTNGSIRDEKWWWDLGVMCGDRLHVVFAVDGKDQEQHEKYRKFTKLDKVLENMKTLSMTKAVPVAQTIAFKHNQNDLEEIKKLCLKWGAKSHAWIWSDRHNLSGKGGFKYTDPDGTKQILEYADRDPEDIKELNLKKTIRDTGNKCISCRWLDLRLVLVNPDGQVLPCCYLANNYYERGPESFNNETMMLYKGQEKEHNIFNKPLEMILAESPWFNKQLPESWESDNPISQCVKWCSKDGAAFNRLQRLSEKK